jgi:hypothetical protein
MCPWTERVRLVTSGPTSPDVAVPVRDHVMDCPPCRELFSERTMHVLPIGLHIALMEVTQQGIPIEVGIADSTQP